MRSEVRRPGVVARAAVLFLCIACAAGTLRADDADPPNSHPYVPAEWQYRWTALNMPPLEVIGSAGDAWLAGELPIQPPANASANVLYLRTRLPSALPRDPHLFVGELPRCWEVYVAGRLVASSVQFGPSERPEGNDIRLHGMIALPQAGEGQWLVLRLWRGDSLGISPTRVAIGSAGSLVLWQIRTFLPFMILGVIMGAVGIGCLVGYTFRPHPRPLLLLGLLSVSFSFISLVQSGLLTLLDCPPYVIALGWELTVLTSCVWVSLLLADLLPGIVARRLLRLAAVLQWAFVMGGLAAHGAQMISFHRLLDIWQNWTVAGTLPVIGIIVVGQLYQRNRDALIIIFVGVVPFGLIALARTLGAPIELVRALPWAAASLTAALAAVTVRKGARVWRQRLADEAVRQSERRMRSMLNATHDLAVLLNREHEILSINEIGAARLHVTIEEALGKCILEFLPGRDRQEPPRRVRAGLGQRRAEAVRGRVQRPHLRSPRLPGRRREPHRRPDRRLQPRHHPATKGRTGAGPGPPARTRDGLEDPVDVARRPVAGRPPGRRRRGADDSLPPDRRRLLRVPPAHLLLLRRARRRRHGQGRAGRPSSGRPPRISSSASLVPTCATRARAGCRNRRKSSPPSTRRSRRT